jgi:putative ABC transport system permease protein
MRDFVSHVRAHLPDRARLGKDYDEIVHELAAELEARYAAAVKRGATDEDAWAEVIAQVPSWPALARALSPGEDQRAASAAWRPTLWSVERWLTECRRGIRMLLRDRAFTVTAMITLTICLGGHAAILSAIDTLVMRPLRVPEPQRVLLMANQYPRAESRWQVLSSTPDYGDRLHRVTVFEEQALYNGFQGTIDVAGVATRLPAMIVTPSFFRVLRVAPAHGRLFTEDEGASGHDTRVMLSNGLWHDLFGGDPNAVGRTIRLNGREFTVVGILPQDFSFPGFEARFWVPLALTDDQRADAARYRNGWFNIGRLKPGATIEQAQEQLKAVDAANIERMPARLRTLLAETGFYTGVRPLPEVLARDVRRPMTLLWIAAIAVLAIGLVNVGNLALVRSRVRSNELGTRLALGASRIDVVGQLMIEGVFVGLGGAAMGLALGRWLTSIVSAGGSTTHLEINAAVAGLTLAIGVAGGSIVGVVLASPAFGSRIDSMLRQRSRAGSHDRAFQTTRRVLIVLQVACSFVLVAGSLALWASLRNLLSVDPGFSTAHVVTGTVSLPQARYTAADARGFVNRSLESIRALPGVAAAGVTTIIPLGNISQTGVVVAEGYVPKAGETPVGVVRSLVTPGYFEAVGTGLISGRYFDERDNRPDARTVIIDEGVANRFWPHGDAVGRRMYWPTDPRHLSKIDENTPWLTVIGIARTARLSGPPMDAPASGTVGTYYEPYAASASRDVSFVIRTTGDPGAIVPSVRTTLARIDGELPLFDVRTMEERRELALIPRTTTMRVSALFAMTAVFLSAIGLYGVLAYLVTQRTQEFGIRLALGSSPRAIVGMIFREGFTLTGVGIVMGVTGSAVFGKAISSQLYGISASNPWMLSAVGVALCTVVALACVVPARRAVGVNLVRALGAP